jgi:ABC-type multidrug transport system ATPase subunit
MTEDMQSLIDGDMTMLGDKGINLSGGQKTRLAIARAIYANRDIIVMDDPISALDIKVGKEIMEQTILGYMKGKTRVIATHAISYLPCFDHIYIMEEGRVVQDGDYDSIRDTPQFGDILQALKDQQDDDKLSRADSFRSLIDEEEVILVRHKSIQRKKSFQESLPRGFSQDKQMSDQQVDPKSLAMNENQIVEITDIVTREDRETGSIPLASKMEWYKMRGGWPIFIWDILLIVVIRYCILRRHWYLQWWSC